MNNPTIILYSTEFSKLDWEDMCDKLDLPKNATEIELTVKTAKAVHFENIDQE